MDAQCHLVREALMRSYVLQDRHLGALKGLCDPAAGQHFGSRRLFSASRTINRHLSQITKHTIYNYTSESVHNQPAIKHERKVECRFVSAITPDMSSDGQHLWLLHDQI